LVSTTDNTLYADEAPKESGLLDIHVIYVMLGTAAFSDGKKIPTGGWDRSPGEDSADDAGDDVVFQMSHGETNPSKATAINQEVLPADHGSTFYLEKQEARVSSLEARSLSKVTSTASRDDATTKCQIAEDDQHRVDQAIRDRPVQKQARLLTVSNFGEEKHLASIPYSGHMGIAPTSCLPQSSEMTESATFIVSKSGPADVTPAYPTEIE
jgi:hypothetical protein